MSTPTKSGSPPSLRFHLTVLAALLVLLLASASLALLPLAVFNTLSALGISVLKTLLVMAFFMRLRHGPPLLRIAAAVGFAWLAVLIGMTVADVLTRVVLPSPW
jgi:cytochrome c oxidase subunit 4